MSKERKTQWHPAFCSAIKLELSADKKYLEYTNEYNLSNKPLQIDLLIIKKAKSYQIKNEIGKLFRVHNIVEYKSPQDSLSVNTFLKVIAYACLYKINEKRMDEIRLRDITLTFVRESFPHKLVKWLKHNGYVVEERYKGIFYVIKRNVFPIQIVVTGRLPKDNQKWLTLLNQNLDEEDAERAIAQTNVLSEKDEKDFADSVLQVAVAENRRVFNETKEEDDNMCEALRELMEPEFNEMKAAAIAEGLAEGRAEGRAEGLAKGRAEGRAEGIMEGRMEAEAEMQEIIEMMRRENEVLKAQISELLEGKKAL